MEIKDILKPEEFRDLTQFTAEEQDWLNKRIHTRKDGKPGVECVVRGKNRDDDYFELKPEEVVRQLYAHRLIENTNTLKSFLIWKFRLCLPGNLILMISASISLFIPTRQGKNSSS